MMRTRIAQALELPEPQKDIKISGWVRTRRDAKGFSFIELNDGSCLNNIQVIVDENTPAFSSLDKVGTGASLEVVGELVLSPGKGQRYEVKAQTLKVFGEADPETFPLQKKRHSDEFLRTIAHLRPRTNKYGAAFRVRSEAAFAVHEFFRERGYFHVHTPILTGSDCEGAGEMFRVTTLPTNEIPQNKENPFENDFFGCEANLTVSGQLEAETLAMGLGQVYTFGPTFRAENSNTHRHAAEFWMIEPEAAFATLDDMMTLGEDITRTVLDRIMTRLPNEMELFDKFVEPGLLEHLKHIVQSDFVKLPYSEAIEILSKTKAKFEYPVSYGLDLQTEHERYLTEQHFKKPVIVYDYPKQIKAFYMRLNDDQQTVAAMDLLVPRIGELIGGSQREERLDILTKRIQDLGQDPENYWWYLDLRRFGSVPHAGFGLGFERLLMLITGINNIRDVIPFPRTPNNLEF
ncbi:asparagine--tRNA ligase [Desulfovibrio litoralis]|nr:asparagine--tRNA ligase [Desulfovibrio litoralis]